MDYWKLLPPRQYIDTGYKIWVETEFCFPCHNGNCGKRTYMMVHLEGIYAHYCSIDCMGGDILEEVLRSKKDPNEGRRADPAPTTGPIGQ